MPVLNQFKVLHPICLYMVPAVNIYVLFGQDLDLLSEFWGYFRPFGLFLGYDI